MMEPIGGHVLVLLETLCTESKEVGLLSYVGRLGIIDEIKRRLGGTILACWIRINHAAGDQGCVLYL